MSQVPLDPPTYMDGDEGQFIVAPVDDVVLVVSAGADGESFDAHMDVVDALLATVTFPD